MTSDWANKLRPDDLVLDALPDEILADMRRRSAWLRTMRSGVEGLEFAVSDVGRWNPGQRVRVAFNSGDAALHREIVETTREITDSCNLILDFGLDANTGKYRSWSTSDTNYAAEIRVTFDKPGNFSLVGTDSVNAQVGTPASSVGGRPSQCSLNLGGFTIIKPNDWQRTVRHEFLHALAFHHEHQNMRGPCEAAFRWEDDAGYEKTMDSRGMYVVDSQGRKPGIYTYLSGYPNNWNKAKVERNLRTVEDPTVVASAFDRKSVMLYRFQEIYYRTLPSPCAPDGYSNSLSEGDKRGLQLLYPHTDSEKAQLRNRRETLLTSVHRTVEEFEGLESSDAFARVARGAEAALMRSLETE